MKVLNEPAECIELADKFELSYGQVQNAIQFIGRKVKPLVNRIIL